MGHSMIGNEMHWLPKEYLAKWWNETIVTAAAAATTTNGYTGTNNKISTPI